MAQEIDERDLLVDDVISIDPEDDPQRPPPGLWDDEEPPFPTDDPEDMVERGGPGSGHFGHAGRPGEVGGSLPGDGQPDDFHSGAFSDEGMSKDYVRQVDKVSKGGFVGKESMPLGKAVFDALRQEGTPLSKDGFLDILSDRKMQTPGGMRQFWILPDATILMVDDHQTSAERAFMRAGEKNKEADAAWGMFTAGNEDYLKAAMLQMGAVRLTQEVGYGFGGGRFAMSASELKRKRMPESNIGVEFYSREGGNERAQRALIASLLKELPSAPVGEYGFQHWTFSDENDISWNSLPETVIDRLDDEDKESKFAARRFGIVLRGGPGSGHFEHEGRPGKRGGSMPSDGPGNAVSTATKDTSAKPFKPAGTKAVKAPISIAPKLVIGEQSDEPKPVEQFTDGSAIVNGRRSWLSEQEIDRAGKAATTIAEPLLQKMDDKVTTATLATDAQLTKKDWTRWDALREAMTQKYMGVVEQFQEMEPGASLDKIRPRFQRAIRDIQSANDALEDELAKAAPDPDAITTHRAELSRLLTENEVVASDALDALAQDFQDVMQAMSSAGVPSFPEGEVSGDTSRIEALSTIGAQEASEHLMSGITATKDFLGKFAKPELRQVAPFKIDNDVYRGMGFSRSKNAMYLDFDATTPQIVHEFGHAIADSDERVGKLAKMFLLYRTQGDGWVGFRGQDDVPVKPDAFISAYAGRYYVQGVNQPLHGDEVFSMGLQFLASNPAEFARRDPEHMAFTLALLAGDWEGAEAVARSGFSFSPLVRRLLPPAAQQTWLDAAQRLAQAFGMAPDAQKPAPPGKPVPAPQEGTVDLLRLPTSLHGSGIWGTAYTTEEASRLAQDVVARQPPEVREALAKAEADLTNREISKHDREMDAGERQRARKRIEHQMLRYGQKEDQPEAVLLAGMPGSGKTTLLNGRAHEFRNYVRLSADDIRSRMPRYEGWNSPLLAEEADDVLERVMMQAVKEKRPLVLDSMLKTGDTAERIIKALGAHGYRTRVIFVDTPMEQAMERAIKRYTSGTGRYVSPAYIASHADKGLHTFERLKSAADTWEHWTNDGDAPKKVGEGKRNA